MSDLTAFNPDDWDFEEQPNYEALPDGEYVVIAVAAEELNKDGSRGVKIGFEVFEGKYKGRIINQWIYFDHVKPVVKEIASKKLKMLCVAAGVARPKDTQDLYDIPVKAYVKTKNDFPDIVRFSEYQKAAPTGPARKSSEIPF